MTELKLARWAVIVSAAFALALLIAVLVSVVSGDDAGCKECKASFAARGLAVPDCCVTCTTDDKCCCLPPHNHPCKCPPEP